MKIIAGNCPLFAHRRLVRGSRSAGREYRDTSLKPQKLNRPYENPPPSHRAVTLIAGFLTAGCAGPQVRHDTRVDRRHDTAERVEDRSSTRQYNRYDRRDDRYDRRDARYGY
jgi:hypothetical protein